MQAAAAAPAGARPQITGIPSSIFTLVILFITMLAAEMIYATTVVAANRFKTLIDYTISSDTASVTIHQDASKYPDAKPVGFSVNERSGIEFSYSFYLYIMPGTFSGDAVMKHVFHKGYDGMWPLMGPGVFIHGNTNTMRVVMNTYKNPFTYVDIKNLPVQKWFHVVLNCYKGGLDVFVNGNLANRIPFKDTLPYQNFEDIILFSPVRRTIRNMEATMGQPLEIGGSMNGLLSNLVYTRYALSMSEIQQLMNAGPSQKMKEVVMSKPPYLSDDWWANQAA